MPPSALINSVSLHTNTLFSHVDIKAANALLSALLPIRKLRRLK